MSRTQAAILGLAFWVASGLLIWGGLEYDVAVDSITGDGRTINLGLINDRALLIDLGVGAAIVGAIFLSRLVAGPIDRMEEAARRGWSSAKQICPVCDEAVSANASVCKWCDADLVPANAEATEE